MIFLAFFFNRKVTMGTSKRTKIIAQNIHLPRIDKRAPYICTVEMVMQEAVMFGILVFIAVVLNVLQTLSGGGDNWSK